MELCHPQLVNEVPSEEKVDWDRLSQNVFPRFTANALRNHYMCSNSCKSREEGPSGATTPFKIRYVYLVLQLFWRFLCAAHMKDGLNFIWCFEFHVCPSVLLVVVNPPPPRSVRSAQPAKQQARRMKLALMSASEFALQKARVRCFSTTLKIKLHAGPVGP